MGNGSTVDGREVFERRTGVTTVDFALLKEMPLFQGLDAEAIRTALADAYVQRFARDTILFMHEEPATRFFIVLEGWVKIFRDTVDGHESVIGVFARGESFAEAAVAKLGAYPASAAVVADARLLSIPGNRFMDQVDRNKTLAMNLMASMSSRMKGFVGQVEQLSSRSSAERLAGFLLQFSDQDSGEAAILLPLDKALIAARLGMQPETFSRSLAKLRRLGVTSKGSSVRIGSVEVLRAFSEGNEPG